MSSRFGKIEATTLRKIIGTKPRRKASVEMVQAAFADCGFCCKWTIPIATASEVNGRDWRKRSKRSNAAWRAVSKALGPHLFDLAFYSSQYHNEGSIAVRLVRLGGKRLDTSNLPTALKAVEDAVAFMLGADDGDPRWKAQWSQEPGGPVGVSVELDLA